MCMPLGLSSPVNLAWLKTFNVSSNYEISYHMWSVETYYPMHLLKFMKLAKFSWRIHVLYTIEDFQFHVFCQMEILFKLRFRVQIEWYLRENEMKNIHSLSFGICLHINVSQAKPNYLFNLYFIWSTCLSVLQSNLLKSFSLFSALKQLPWSS